MRLTSVLRGSKAGFKEKIPKYIIGVTGYEYFRQPPKHTSRAAMYRAVLQHLRLLPDPVLWLHYAPQMRRLCNWDNKTAENEQEEDEEGDDDTDWNSASTSNGEVDVAKRRELKRMKTLKGAKEILTEVRGAVACHPHVLRRAIETAYDQRGKRRYDLLRTVQQTSPVTDEVSPYQHHLGNRPAIPKPLLPLLKQTPQILGMIRSIGGPEDKGSATQKGGQEKEQSKRQSIMLWTKMFKGVPVPLRFPDGTGVRTGIEHLGMLETIQAFARVGEAYEIALGRGPRDRHNEARHTSAADEQQYGVPAWHELSSFDQLSPILQRIFPKKLRPTMREPPLPKPQRHETKANPHTWRNPVPLTYRMITRNYLHVWNNMRWTRPATSDPQGRWVECDYTDVVYWEQGRFSEMGRSAGPPKPNEVRDGPEAWSRMDGFRPVEAKWRKMTEKRKSTKDTIDRVARTGDWRKAG